MRLTKHWFFVVGVTAIGAVALAATGCSDDDSTPSGSSSSSSGSNTSSSSSSSSSSGGGTQTLYERLGKKDGIKGALDKILAAELADPEIASYFLFVGKPGHPPSSAAIEECLVNQLGSAAGGPASEVTYPTTTSEGFTCRDMKTTHAGLGIPPGTFDKFVTIAAGELKKAGVADDDIATIGTVLNGTKGDVVTDNTRTEGPFNQDAGQ